MSLLQESLLRKRIRWAAKNISADDLTPAEQCVQEALINYIEKGTCTIAGDMAFDGYLNSKCVPTNL